MRLKLLLIVVVCIGCASTRNAPVEALVPLDQIGIADARFLNPKKPFALAYGAGPESSPPPLVFENRTSDREMLVQLSFQAAIDMGGLAQRGVEQAGTSTLSMRLTSAREKLNEEVDKYKKQVTNDLKGVDKLECDPKTAKASVPESDVIIVPCSVRFKVSRGHPVSIPYAFVQHLPDVFTFDVSFFEETEKPANNRGYVAKVSSPRSASSVFERDSKVEITPVGVVSAILDPELRSVAADGKTPVIDEAHPYRGERRTHATGEARVDFSGNYANDVDAEVSFQFKRSDLGADDGKTSVEVSQYKMRVFLSNGLRTEFGKFRFSNPSDGIAVNERGEGIRFDLGSVRLPRAIGSPSVSYIVKRESASPLLATDKGDRNVAIFEWKNLPLAWYLRDGARLVPTAPFRTVNLLALWGRDEDPADDHTYTTIGAETSFTHRRGATAAERATQEGVARRGYVTGSLAAYHSSRTSSTSKAEGAGHVFLAKLNFSPRLAVDGAKTTAPLTYGAVFGWGSGDDTGTASNEGYVGETQSFAPDTLFLSSLAKPLVDGGSVALRPGLSGKLYQSVRLTMNQSPLRWIAHQLENDADVRSSTTIFTLHNYWLTKDRLAHAGTEADLEFQLIAPSRVRMSVGFAYFIPGDSLERQIAVSPWAVSVTLAVDPKL